MGNMLVGVVIMVLCCVDVSMKVVTVSGTIILGRCHHVEDCCLGILFITVT